jgi:hypothetical protein
VDIPVLSQMIPQQYTVTPKEAGNLCIRRARSFAEAPTGLKRSVEDLGDNSYFVVLSPLMRFAHLAITHRPEGILISL